MVVVAVTCAIVGDSVFDVEIDDGAKVSAFKKAIRAEMPKRITCDAVDLRLFLAKMDTTSTGWLNWAGLESVTLDGDRCPRGFEEMNPTLAVKNPALFGEDFKPGQDEIHVLVVVATELVTRVEPRDSSGEWLAEFCTKRVEFDSLPFVGSLVGFVARPLPVKIRAKKKWLDKWKLKSELQEKMFVLDDAAPSVEFKGLIFHRRALKQLRRGQTESSYHYLWDSVFRNVLDYLFTRARMERDSCNGSSTGTKRPDFLFILDNVCVFRGEEKSAEIDIRVATEELCEQLEWGYGRVPYVFGYAASGDHIDLLALHQDDGVVKSSRIGAFNLELKEHLFEAVLAILNLSLLFPAIVEACPASGKDEYKDITRPSGVVVRLYPAFVEKVFPTASGLDGLMQLYVRMEQAGVPNVDHLVGVRLRKKSLVFKPRGVAVKPSNLLELLGALRDVLQALVALHRLGWMHRDIRWSNVIRTRDGGSWFLIDFADAAASPQRSPSGQHLSVEEHAPEIFLDDGVHTTAVDIWAVGFLIETSGVAWLDFADRSSFYGRLMAKDPAARPSAEEALAAVGALEEEEATRQEEADREVHDREFYTPHRAEPHASSAG
jgi:hypothetical protein